MIQKLAVLAEALEKKIIEAAARAAESAEAAEAAAKTARAARASAGEGGLGMNLRHDEVPGGFLCPVTRKIAKYVWTDHANEGSFNSCNHCTGENRSVAGDLQRLNRRRAKAVGERLEERAGLVDRRAAAEERYFKAPHDTAEEAAAEAEMEAAEAAIEKLDEAVAWAKEEAREDDIRAAQEQYDQQTMRRVQD